MNTPVVLITGALTGIGRATAMAFAKGGASVVVSGRREDAGRALAAGCALSVRKPSSCRPMCRTRTRSAASSIRQ
jgi:NAD(P)-dependent dehydrogenase (short-subunit alcohol dehydrogenase family)